MQLKHYNRLMTRTIQRPCRGETSNEVTALRFSVDCAGVLQPLLQRTGRWVGVVIPYGRETTWRSSSSLLFVFLSLSLFPSFRKLPASIFASLRELQPVRKLHSSAERCLDQKEKEETRSPYVSLKTFSSSSLSWIRAVGSRNVFTGAYAPDALCASNYPLLKIVSLSVFDFLVYRFTLTANFDLRICFPDD